MLDLTRHCDPKRRGIDEPFSLDGWTCATEGHYIVAVRTDRPDAGYPPGRKMILDFLREPAGSYNCPLLDLRRFVGALPDRPTCPDCCNGETTCKECSGEGKLTSCDVCDGRGKESTADNPDEPDCYLCKGSGREPCNVCDGDGHYKCDTCDGAGTLAPECRIGWIFGVCFDLNLITRALDVARPDDMIAMRWSALSSALAIHGNKWRVCIMPYRADMSDSEYTEAPRFGVGALDGQPVKIATAEYKAPKKHRK